MRINLRVDTARFDREVKTYIDKVVRPAEAAGLNKAAELSKGELQDETTRAFHKPKPFTKTAFTFYKATARKGKEPNAKIRVKSIQSQYFDFQVTGRTRRAGDYSTTKYGPVVPGRSAKLTVYGGLPNRYLKSQAARKDTYWGDIGKRGELWGLLKRDKSGGIKVLAVVLDHLKIPAQFDFYGVVRKGAKRHVAREVRSELAARARRAEASD